MRLISCDIEGFGKWRQQHFDFSPNLQLLYGHNEAGKTTLYQFISAILFGFPDNRRKNQPTYQPKGGSFGGSLTFWDEEAGKVRVTRFKEDREAKVEVLESGKHVQLATLLGENAAELFETIYSFKQEQLQEFQQVEASDLEQQLLAVGSVGSQKILLESQRLEKNAQKLYSPRARKKPLNRALQAYEELQQKIKSKEQVEQQFQKLLEEAAAAENAAAEIDQKLAENHQTTEQLFRRKSLLPLYLERQAIQSALGKVKLSESEAADLRDLYQTTEKWRHELGQLEESYLSQSGLTNEESARYTYYLAHEAAIRQTLERTEDVLLQQEKINYTKQNLEKMTLECAVYEQRWHWESKRPPDSFSKAMKEQVEVWQRAESSQDAALSAIETAISEKERRKGDLEHALERLEKEHPYLKDGKTQKTAGKLPLILLAAALLAAVFTRWHWPFLLAALLAGAAAFFQRTRHSPNKVKDNWQQLLYQLDQTQQQLNELEVQKQKSTAVKMKRRSEVLQFAEHHHLGTFQQVSEWANASRQTEIDRYLTLLKEADEEKRQLAALEKSQEEAARSVAPWRVWADAEAADLLGAYRALEKAASEMEKIRFAEKQQATNRIQEKIQAKKQEIEHAKQAAAPLLKKAKLTDDFEIPAFLNSLDQTQQKRQRLAELEQQLNQMAPDFSREPQNGWTAERIAQQQQTAESARAELQQRKNALTEKRQTLAFQIKQQKADGTLADLYQERAERKSRIKELFDRYTAARLSALMFARILTQKETSSLPQVLKEAGRYFTQLTNGHYCDLFLKEDELFVRTEKLDTFHVYELSSGAKDQLMFALRLAFIRLMSTKKRFPVIIDDGWLHYDEKRKQAMIELLSEFAQNEQVILLTSDEFLKRWFASHQQPAVMLDQASAGEE